MGGCVDGILVFPTSSWFVCFCFFCFVFFCFVVFVVVFFVVVFFLFLFLFFPFLSNFDTVYKTHIYI